MTEREIALKESPPFQNLTASIQLRPVAAPMPDIGNDAGTAF
jgi:hypothetical protein